MTDSHETWPRIVHHGGATGVTGSCHQLDADDEHALLVDCGLFQGADAAADTFGQHTVDFDTARIAALVLTHVHIDHVGRLPYLLAAGYRGPILCSRPTAQLLPLVLDDALRLGFTDDDALIERVQDQVQQQLQPLDYGKGHDVVDTAGLRLRVKLQRAGHILGSAYVEVAVHDRRRDRKKRVVFSGDLGAPHAPLLPAPRSPYAADILVLESTYGDRQHPDRRQRRQRLAGAIERALHNGGSIIVPAFSIGRTQELLYELEALSHAGQGVWRDLPVILDSPLATRFTRVYRRLRGYWDAEAHRRLEVGRRPLAFDRLHVVASHDDHERSVARLAQGEQSAVILAASGMCTGGRVVNYLKAMLGDDRHQVLFVGYQARGTPGRAIQEYGPDHGWVELDGERYTIHAGVETIGGYSAHADRNDLLRFVRRMKRWPRRIHLVHGETDARQALATELEHLYQRHELPVTILPEP